MKKSIALLLVLLMAAAAFAGCAAEQPAGPQEPAPAPEAPKPAEPEPPKTTTLTVVTSYGGDDGNRQNFQNAVSEYETLTGNKVQDGSATSNEQWKAKVMTDFETGTEPDVLFYFLGNDANPFIEANKVVSLDEIRAAYPDYAGNMKESMLVP
ncbi:MAG TPA: ABC transporter substrate-binding protein, partial [Clostridia bacterium]|nr:ABC transporter substrate-binding protein [Clostridia bacterium]